MNKTAKKFAGISAVGLASLAFQTAGGAVLIGKLSKTANTCPTAIGALNGDDCSYNDSYNQIDTDPWVGPGKSSGFYASSLANGVWTNEPNAGDGKVNPTVTANLTIDGSNQVSGTIVIGAVAFHNFSAGPTGRGEDGWTSATITLVPKVADSVVGSTVVIGSAGFPPYIQAANATDQFPSETAADSNNSASSPDVLWWATPPPTIGITNVEGNTGTTGTMALADVVGWTCNDVDGNPATGACNSASSFRARQNFENVVLKITKDGSNNPIAVEGFLVQGGAGAPNPATTPNWVAWTFRASIDTDADGRPNYEDNCKLVANNTGASAQCDSDGDGFGNRCDGDYNNNGVTNSQDYVLFRQQLGQPSVGPTYNKADLNCNAAVNSQDYVLFRSLLGKVPGPSGLVP